MLQVNTVAISGYRYAFVPFSNAKNKTITLHSVKRCWTGTEYISDWSIYEPTINPNGFYIRTTNPDYANVEWIEVWFIVS